MVRIFILLQTVEICCIQFALLQIIELVCVCMYCDAWVQPEISHLIFVTFCYSLFNFLKLAETINKLLGTPTNGSQTTSSCLLQYTLVLMLINWYWSPRVICFTCSCVFKRKSWDATSAGGPRVWRPGEILSQIFGEYCLKHQANILSKIVSK